MHTYTQMYIRKQIQAIESDTSLDESERTRRKQVTESTVQSCAYITRTYIQCIIHHALYTCTHTYPTYTYTHIQNLLKLSLGSSSSGMSPEAVIQPHSLPSSVSDALEAMVGGGLDDLTLEDIESSNTNLADDASEVTSVHVCTCMYDIRYLHNHVTGLLYLNCVSKNFSYIFSCVCGRN